MRYLQSFMRTYEYVVAILKTDLIPCNCNGKWPINEDMSKFSLQDQDT